MRFIIVVFLACSILPMFRCAEPAERFPGAPVILISVDTLRSDRLPAYGYNAIQTPAFDRFARDSILFERAYSNVPLTLPSHASLFTGRLPPRHGARENVGFKLTDRELTLAEALKAEGYQTGAAVSTMVLRKSTGIAQGFDFYDDAFELDRKNNVKSYQERSGALSIRSANSWLERLDENPFFFWLHLYEPHSPYEPPPSFRKPGQHPYDGEVVYSDALLGEFFADLKEKGLYDKAIIILLSDHGEGLGEHGEEEHGVFTYREAIQVPLMIKLPGGSRGGARIAAPVSLVDIMPTVLDLLAIPVPECEGLALLSSKKPPKDRAIYSEALTAELHYGWFASRSVIHESLHYIEGHQPELFDLSVDFSEKNNVFGTRKISSASIRLMDAMAQGKSETVNISDEDKALLQSLGYTGGFDLGDSAKSLSVAAFLETYDKINISQKLINTGKLDEAEALLGQLLASYPSMLDFRILLGHVYNLKKNYTSAEFLYMEGLAVAPEHQGMLQGLIAAKLGLGKNDEADKLASRCMEVAPVLSGRKIILMFFEAGDYPRAVKYAQMVRESDPDFALMYFMLGELAGGRRDVAQCLAEGLRLHGGSLEPAKIVSVLYFLGDSLGRMGLEELAISVFLEGLERNPKHPDIRAGLSKAYVSLKRGKEGIQILDDWVRDYPSRANYLHAAKTMEIVGFEEAARFYRKEAEKYPLDDQPEP